MDSSTHCGEVAITERRRGERERREGPNCKPQSSAFLPSFVFCLTDSEASAAAAAAIELQLLLLFKLLRGK